MVPRSSISVLLGIYIGCSVFKCMMNVEAVRPIRGVSRDQLPRQWHLYLGEPLSYDTLKSLSERFPIQPPIVTTKMDYIVEHAAERGQTSADVKSKIAEFARSATPIVHEKTVDLMDKFIKFKQINGSSIEKELYKHMTIADFLDRLLTQRPFMFVDTDDDAILRDRTRVRGGFELIGTENEKPPLVLKDYISYDEMKISALILVSSASYFINNGNRYSHGVTQKSGTFEDAGIVINVIGPRFERSNVMEYQDIIVTPDQNTPENGYGLEGLKANTVAAARLKLFAEFYGISCFPSYTEAKEGGAVVRIGPQKTTATFGMSDVLVERFLVTAEAVILEAERQAASAKQFGYVRVVGYGLGVWRYPGWYDERAWRKAIERLMLEFVTDIDFIWLHEGASKEFGIMSDSKLGNVTIHFSDNNPQDRLIGNNKGKLLIVTNAGDSNAYPGNEFWGGSLDGSGDAAAACSTQIAELHNPMINIHLRGNRLLVASPTDNYVYSGNAYLGAPF